MGTRLWEYRKPSTEIDRLVYCWHDGILQMMGVDSAGEMVFHTIDELDFAPDETFAFPEAKSGIIKMLLAEPFHIMPKEFSSTVILNSDANLRTDKPDELVRISYASSSKAVHAALPMYLTGKKAAGRSEYFLFCFVAYPICLVFLYKNGQCELANMYPAANESEVLYYCMAVAKKSGADVRNVRFEVLGTEAQNVLDSLHRFIPNAALHRMDLPYPTGEYPPFAAVSYLMHQYLQCELPEEI